MGRESFLTPVEWQTDEWPVIHQPRMSFTSTRTLQSRSATFLDKIRSLQPHLSDLYLHSPLDYDPYTSPTSVALLPTKNDLSSSHGTALLARRQRSFDCVARTSVVFPTNEAEVQRVTAGLTVYKDALRHLSIAVDFATRVLSVHFVDVSKSHDFTAAHSDPVPESTRAVELRIVSNSGGYEFAFRQEGGEAWATVGCADAALLTARDFTGSVFGVFAVCAEDDMHGSKVRFDDFAVED